MNLIEVTTPAHQLEFIEMAVRLYRDEKNWIRPIDQDIEGLARIGVACFRLLLAEAGPRFNENAWDLTTAALVRLFALTTPKDLIAARRKLLGATAEEEAAEAAALAPFLAVRKVGLRREQRTARSG